MVLLVAVTVAVRVEVALTTIDAAMSRPLVVAIRLSVDPSISSQGVTAQLKDEAEVIWKPYGIQLDWADADPSEHGGGTVWLDASVEREFERRRQPQWKRVLGRVVTNPNPPHWREIHVSFDATESVLAQRTTKRSIAGIVLERELARALGRVLAHEIGHVLIGVPSHDSTGLMRASFPAEELAEPDRSPFRLTCSSADRLRSRLAALTGHAQIGSHRDPGPSTLKVCAG
jgi:hypothetical protein